MRIAMITRITPPATSSERSDSRISVRKPCPDTMNSTSTANAISTSRSATKVRRSGFTAPRMEMNTGRLPKGSSTSRSRMNAERKV